MKPAEPVTSFMANPGRSDGESDLWAEVQKGNSVEDYRAYLAQYPKGKFAVLAKGRLTKFETEAADVARAQREAQAQQQAQQEQAAWDAANSSASEASYQSYLNQYPRGKYETLASGRITKLRNEAAQAQQAAERQRQQAATSSTAGAGSAMVRIPAGSIQIGSSQDADNLVRMVTVQAFELGKYHVTRGEFAKFVSETGYDAGNSCYVWTGKWEERSGSNWRNPGFSQDDSHPVTCVNWNDAQAYVSWLSKKTGRQYRLPNETEWEYACYGGSKTEYCGSNDISAVAWYRGNSNSSTHPVGQKQANGYGLYDMSGNVWQWMENCYDSSCSGRALRGGSWSGVPQFVRAAYRIFSAPAVRNSNRGFRVARTLP